MVRGRRTHLLVGGVFCALVAGGCRSEQEPKRREAEAPVTAVPIPKPAAACTDWSSYDFSSLPPLPPNEHAGLLDQVWRRVAEKHHDPTLGCLDWLSLRTRHGARLSGTTDADAAYRVIGEMLGELGQSHFKLFPPAEGEDLPGPATLPVRLRWIEGELVVVQSDEPRIPVGAALREIEDVPISTLRTRAEIMGSHEPAELALELGRLAAIRLSCPRAGAARTITLETSPAATLEVTATCQPPKGERVTLGHLVDIPTEVHHRMLPGGIGVLGFNVWMLPMLARLEAAMQALQGAGMRGLIVDLRGNPGGVGPMCVPVARLLLSAPASLGSLKFRDFAQEFNVAANPTAFDGPVVILVDENTASTSEIFAIGLRDLGRATIVGGQRSAGAALPSVIEELRDGAILQYVVGFYRSPRGTVVEGQGIEPDVAVHETRAAFAAGRDIVLETAVTHLRESLKAEHP